MGNGGHFEAPSYTLSAKDFLDRIVRIMNEFIMGWQFLADFKKTVTIFGSNRVANGNRWYGEAMKLGDMVAQAGFDLVTGSGRGIMEAGNRGALEAAKRVQGQDGEKTVGKSIGLHIMLPNGQQKNKYVMLSRDFHYFFVRKVMLSYHRAAYVYFPGGYGTLDGLFEILTLIQTKKMKPVSVILAKFM